MKRILITLLALVPCLSSAQVQPYSLGWGVDKRVVQIVDFDAFQRFDYAVPPHTKGNTWDTVGSPSLTASGINGRSMSLPGNTSNYLDRPMSEASYYMTNSWTYSFWFNPDNPTGYKQMVSKWRNTDNNNCFMFYLAGTNVVGCLLNNTDGLGGDVGAEIAATYTAGSWNHYCATFNPSDGRLICYINGVQIYNGTSASTGGMKYSADAIKAGVRNIDTGTLDSPFAGKLDQFFVTLKILSAQEVRELYEREKCLIR